jgi:hypothetical protein
MSKKEPTAVIDRSNVSWRDSKRASKLFYRMETLDIQDPDEWEEEYDSLWDQIQEHLSKVIVSIPQEWLVSDAPEDLDWSDGTSIDWIRSDKISDLIAEETDSAAQGE